MKKQTKPVQPLTCIHCKQAVAIPDFVKPGQVWVGTCSNGHKALYSCPAPHEAQ